MLPHLPGFREQAWWLQGSLGSRCFQVCYHQPGFSAQAAGECGLPLPATWWQE